MTRAAHTGLLRQPSRQPTPAGKGIRNSTSSGVRATVLYGIPCRTSGGDGYHAAGKGISHFEFRWAYYFNSGYLDASLWDSETRHAAFVRQLDAMPPTRLDTAVDEDAWTKLSQTVFYLARSRSNQDFVVPDSLGDIAGKLPGAQTGTGPIDHPDPDCAAAICPSCAERRGAACSRVDA